MSAQRLPVRIRPNPSPAVSREVSRAGVAAVSRHPLDRSAAFTALLEFAPWFGRMESREAEVVVTWFLADFYRSGSKHMAAYARRWVADAADAAPEVARRDQG